VAVASGRLPRPCERGPCEALALAGRLAPGQRERLGHAVVQIVGTGSLASAAVGDRSQLGRRALLVASMSGPLRAVAATVGSNVLASAVLSPQRTHGFDLDALVRRLRGAVRVLVDDPSEEIRASAPLGLLDELVRRGNVNRT